MRPDRLVGKDRLDELIRSPREEEIKRALRGVRSGVKGRENPLKFLSPEIAAIDGENAIHVDDEVALKEGNLVGNEQAAPQSRHQFLCAGRMARLRQFQVQRRAGRERLELIDARGELGPILGEEESLQGAVL